MLKQLFLPAALRCRTYLSLGFALVAALCVAAACAQQPAPANPPAQQTTPNPPASQQPADQQPEQGPDTVFHIGANEVNLIFTVTDKHGRYVPNLQLQDFALLDDRKPRRKSPLSISRSIFHCASAS